MAQDPLRSPAFSPAEEETPLEGLSEEEARARRERYGPNSIVRAAKTSVWRLLARQFTGASIWLLLGAAIIAAAVGEVADAVAIAAILIVNALVGFFQEHRADRALSALRAMTAPTAKVRRGGTLAILPAAEVVPGDRLLMEAGDIIAADLRLTLAHALKTDESTLTGESVPTEKEAGPWVSEGPLSERHSCLYMGTIVVTGSGEGVVVATGSDTEVGRIASLLAETESPHTPLQDRLDRVGRTLVALCLGVVALVAGLGLARGEPLGSVLLAAVSLAVAAVPEGLAAVVTISLAVGVQRLAAQHVLIRRLPSVETLGSTTYICTDKTGTLTAGVMKVRELVGPEPKALLRAAVACCDAELNPEGGGGTGDPTEIALLLAAAEGGLTRGELEAEAPRKRVDPFDADLKRMSILRADGVLYVKGALEVLLPGAVAQPEGILAANERMAAQGLRVLAVATAPEGDEGALTLLGLVGIADPPRPEVKVAIERARRAGIQTVMITGDHPVTARAIALELGILQPGEASGQRVYARATPEDKLRIVRALKEQGEVVAMTGDGVNDAPALKEAHIGVAMGLQGTDVAREASDMVLADDNYASIVSAVKEGRGIFDNIQRALVYLLSGNVGELALMLGAALAGMPAPLLPLHLLWVNLVTDGLPALALVLEPTHPEALNRPPRPQETPILGKPQWRFILLTGLVDASVTLGVFVWALEHRSLLEARDLAFTTLVMIEVLRAFAARSPRLLFWEVGPFSNLRLLAAVGLSVVAHVALHVIPGARELFHLADLSLLDWGLAFGLGLIPVTLLELFKLVRRRFSPGSV